MIGRQISHYRLTDHVNDGVMGVVYKAQDLTLERTVAIKAIKGPHQDDSIAAKRFLREARAVSQIHHPNVITLYDIVEQPDASFLIMEYIAGPSLRDRINKAPIDPASRQSWRWMHRVPGGTRRPRIHFSRGTTQPQLWLRR